VQEAHRVLRQIADQVSLNFAGNVEGKDIMAGAADVIVADGFAGNVALKTAEGVASTLMTLIRREIKASRLASVGGLLARPAFRRVASVLDYREYGGAPLLGVNGVVIIGHGRSDALAIENAIRVAIRAAELRVVDVIRDGMDAAMETLNATSPDLARSLMQDEP
jgi:phosphate acyltransferase